MWVKCISKHAEQYDCQAKWQDADEKPRLKVSNGCRCGAGYTPPEALQSRPLTPAADVYQFGGLCYFMAVGSPTPTPLDPTTGTLFTSRALDDITIMAQKAMGSSSHKPVTLLCCTSTCLKAWPAASCALILHIPTSKLQPSL